MSLKNRSSKEKPFHCLPLILLFTLLLLASCSGHKEPVEKKTPKSSPEPKPHLVEPKLLLTIDDQPFTTKEYDRFIQFKYANIKTLSDVSDRLQSRFFDAFVDHTLLLTVAQKAGVEVSQAESAAYITDLRIDTGNHDEQILSEEAVIQKYLFNQAYSTIDVDTKECQRYYNTNRQQFRRKKQIMLHQILIKDQKKAFEIKELLDSDPSRFEEFALTESQSSDAAQNGTMGFFEMGQLPQEIEKFVFALKKNDISQVIQSPYGYHIFRVSQIRPEQNLYFDAVKDEIKETLLTEKLREAYNTLLADLKKNHTILTTHENLPFKYVSNDNGGNNETQT